MHRLSDTIDRKYTDTFNISDWEIDTDSGWQDIQSISKTIPYDVWEIRTETNKQLLCADDHIILDVDLNEIFVKDCHLNKTRIMTVDGPEKVISCEKIHDPEPMYDMSVSGNNRYWSNGILSHNSTTVAAFFLHYVLFNKNKLVAILANKADSAREIMGRIQMMFELLPDWLQQGVVDWNKGSFLLENGSRAISASTSSSTIRGKAINCITGDSKVTVRDKESGEIKRISIHELEKELS